MALNKQLTIKQLREYPPEALKLNVPDATSEGRAKVGIGRGGPFGLHYKVYGHGSIKILWISGHGDGIENWYDTIRAFGVDNADKYTSMIFENRGIGESGSPWSIGTMKDLAHDAKDLLDERGWTEQSSVHVVGHSMGGMIAMTLAHLHPDITASLILLSTTSHWLRSFPLLGNLKSSSGFALAWTADSRLTLVKQQFFQPSWLNSPDPTGVFPTQGDAWAARFINIPIYSRGAIICAPACIGHRLDPKDLKAIVERLGKGNVAILHGTADKMLPVDGARRMYTEFGGDDSGVRYLEMPDCGHISQVQCRDEVVKLVEEMVNGGTSHARDGVEA